MSGRGSRPEGVSPDAKREPSQLLAYSGGWGEGQRAGVLTSIQLLEHPCPKWADAFPF